jgi:glycosyltransferase involved in cell wall biosynthesis
MMIKVSVALKTYNHEKYIAQAIESVLMQKTNFDYELVIGEDCSTDRTREIVTGYGQKYPGRIRVLLSEQNLGGRENFIRTISACLGTYIALLDGDDYWTAPDKLQKQANFLDAHPDAAICFHKVGKLKYDRIIVKTIVPPRNQEIHTLEDLLRHCNFLATSATMFRRGLFGQFPEWYTKSPYGDFPLHILNALHGQIGYINERMGVYRRHSGGMWSEQPRTVKLKNTIMMHEIIDSALDFKYHDLIQAKVLQLKDQLAREYKKPKILKYMIDLLKWGRIRRME